MDDIIATFLASGAKRMDGIWKSYEYKIYWAGIIIRIDLKPMETS